MGRNQIFPQIGNQKSVKFEIKVTQNWQKLNFHTLMTTKCFKIEDFVVFTFTFFQILAPSNLKISKKGLYTVYQNYLEHCTEI